MATTELNETDKQPLETDAEPPERRIALKWYVVAAAVVIVAGALTYRYFAARETTDDAQVEAHIHPVSARVTGTAVRVNVKDNQYVEAGTVLAELDPKDYQVAVDKARADLMDAEAMASAGRTDVPMTSTTTASRVSGSEAGVKEAQTSLESTQQELAAAKSRVESQQARVREAQANAQRAAKDLERFKRLVAKEEISQQQYDAAVAENESRQAAVDSVRAQVREAEQSVRVAESNVQRERARLAQAQANLAASQTAPQQVAMTKARSDSAAAHVEQAKAQLEQAQLNLSYTRIVAPVAGLVAKKSLETGQTVQAGQPLLAVVALENIWIVANFKETQLRDMRPGQAVDIEVDAYGGRQYRGRVDSISAATGARFSLMPPENASGNFVKVVQRVPVKIILEKGQDPEHLLRPGMSVVPTVLTR